MTCTICFAPIQRLTAYRCTKEGLPDYLKKKPHAAQCTPCIESWAIERYKKGHTPKCPAHGCNSVIPSGIYSHGLSQSIHLRVRASRFFENRPVTLILTAGIPLLIVNITYGAAIAVASVAAGVATRTISKAEGIGALAIVGGALAGAKVLGLMGSPDELQQAVAAAILCSVVEVGMGEEIFPRIIGERIIVGVGSVAIGSASAGLENAVMFLTEIRGSPRSYEMAITAAEMVIRAASVAMKVLAVLIGREAAEAPENRNNLAIGGAVAGLVGGSALFYGGGVMLAGTLAALSVVGTFLKDRQIRHMI